MVENRPAVYSANIMLFIERADSQPFFPQTVSQAIRFLPKHYDQQYLQGLLFLRTDLSSSAAPTASEGSLVDPDAQAIALPVPAERRDPARRSKVLPGAPLAFVTLKVDGYKNSQTLLEWCGQHGDFEPSVLDQLRDYFAPGGAGQTIRSFVSQPLFRDGAPFAVLNLHADRTDILGPAPERLEVFQAMLRPFLNELTSTLLLLLEAESQSGA